MYGGRKDSFFLHVSLCLEERDTFEAALGGNICRSWRCQLGGIPKSVASACEHREAHGVFQEMEMSKGFLGVT